MKRDADKTPDPMHERLRGDPHYELGRAKAQLRLLYDAVQRGDFDVVGVDRSPEARQTIELLREHGDTFDEFGRRSGARDKHGVVRP